jgi:four helix bundle protein
MAKTFRDLDVYKKAFDVSLQMHKLSLTLPSIEQYALANQMRRASKSICANIAEGFGKQSSSKNEFRRFLSMAQGSCQEMKVWLEYCLALHYIQQSEYDEYYDSYDHVARMLQKLHSKSDSVSAFSVSSEI